MMEQYYCMAKGGFVFCVGWFENRNDAEKAARKTGYILFLYDRKELERLKEDIEDLLYV